MRFRLCDNAGNRPSHRTDRDRVLRLASSTRTARRLSTRSTSTCAARNFQHRITNTVTAALAMKSDLDGERRASERSLANGRSRSRCFFEQRGMYGELQAIVGSALNRSLP